MTFKKTFLIMLFVLLHLAARSPQLIPYQGIYYENGLPVDGSRAFVFEIYGSLSGNDLVWQSPERDLLVVNGVYSYVLGSDAGVSNAFSDIDWTSGSLFLDVSINGASRGRVEFTSVPYAFNAEQLVLGGSVSGLGKSVMIKAQDSSDDIGGDIRFSSGIGLSGNGNFIYQNGLIGVGTDTPLSELDIRNDGLVTLRLIDESTTGASESDLVLADGSIRLSAVSGGVSSNSGLSYYYNNNSLLKVDLYGNLNAAGGAIFNGSVGIGTDSPAAKLSLGNSGNATKLIIHQGSVTGDNIGLGANPSQFRMHLNNSGSRFSFLNAPLGGEVMTIKGNGNVGIGTVSPSARLSLGTGTNASKLLVYDDGTYKMGFGIDYGQFQFHLDGIYSRYALLDSPAGNELMTVQGNGNVGIGDSSPVVPLEIRSANYEKLRLTSSGSSKTDVGFCNYMTFYDGSGDSTNAKAGTFGFPSTSNNRLYIRNFSPLPGLLGSIYMTTEGVTTRLYVNGTAVGGINLSDSSLKREVKTMDSGIDVVTNLLPRSFYWTDTALNNYKYETNIQIGFIAQEVEPYIPEAIGETAFGHKSLDTRQIIPYLVNAIKEQQQQIEELKLQNESLETRIEVLESN